MDANRNIIPIVEGDQGEGFKNPYEGDDGPFEKILEKQTNKTLKDSYQDQVEQKLSEVEALTEQLPPKPMTIKKGMVIHFYGFAYKCTAARPNGKITLKFKGLWKGESHGSKT